MKFSIIIPVFNVETFLPKCLNSALSQSFDDYEIITVNDGSTDNSRKILSEYEAASTRIIIIDQENKGLGGARNTGIQYASGDFVIFLDSDDYISVNMLQELDHYLTAYDLDILAFDCNMVDKAGNILQTSTRPDIPHKYTTLSKEQFLLLEPTACLKVYRRSLYLDHAILFPEQLWYEDLATIFKLAPYANRIGYLKETLYNYVQHNASITHSQNTNRMMEIITAFEYTLQYYKQNNLFELFYAELEWNCILHVFYYSAFRFLGCGYHRKAMNYLYRYSKATFPQWEQNKYFLQMRDNRYLMNLLVGRHYFEFYLKTGFYLQYINPVLVKMQKIRGATSGNKANNP